MKIFNTITPRQLNDMRTSVGWRRIPDEQAKRALENSMINIRIEHNSEVAAIGRLVGDGCFKAMLTDIIVKPQYQQQGFGKIIISEILRLTKSSMLPGEQLCIEACPTAGNREFYIRCGFIYDPDEQDGVSLWIRKGDHS